MFEITTIKLKRILALAVFGALAAGIFLPVSAQKPQEKRDLQENEKQEKGQSRQRDQDQKQKEQAARQQAQQEKQQQAAQQKQQRAEQLRVQQQAGQQRQQQAAQQRQQQSELQRQQRAAQQQQQQLAAQQRQQQAAVQRQQLQGTRQRQQVNSQQQQRLARYRQQAQTQDRLGAQRAAQLQQQNRNAQYRFQQQYLERQRQQIQAQNARAYDYNNDPNFYSAASYRYTRGGRTYQTNQYGADLLQQAVNNGYEEGFQAGQADREDKWRNGRYQDSYAYQDANFGYNGYYVEQSEYNYYFRQGFQRGYEDGNNSRSQYGSSSNGGNSILTAVLSQILNLTGF